jgi:hypothetical protein
MKDHKKKFAKRFIQLGMAQESGAAPEMLKKKLHKAERSKKRAMKQINKELSEQEHLGDAIESDSVDLEQQVLYEHAVEIYANGEYFKTYHPTACHKIGAVRAALELAARDVELNLPGYTVSIEVKSVEILEEVKYKF